MALLMAFAAVLTFLLARRSVSEEARRTDP